MSHEIEATPSLLTRINGALLIRPGEGRRSALLFTHLLLASAVFVMGRTVRDTLFLSRASIDQLPWMFVLYGIASAITVLIYSRLADRLPRERAIMVWCGIGVVSYLATWCAVRASLGWIYPTFYVWSEVFANLAISQFWTLANELHDPRAAKRLFGTIGAARVLGVIVVGLGAGSIVQAIGTEQLLFVLAALQLGIGALAAKLAKEPRATKAMPETTPVERRRKPPSILGNHYVWSLSVDAALCLRSAHDRRLSVQGDRTPDLQRRRARAVLLVLLRGHRNRLVHLPNLRHPTPARAPWCGCRHERDAKCLWARECDLTRASNPCPSRR